MNTEVCFEEVRSASAPEQLRHARLNAQARIYDKFSVTDIEAWNRDVSRLQDIVMTRAAELCEQQMEKEGFVPPPAPYAVVLFGSAGREEQTLWSDQDNGLIFGKSKGMDEEAVKGYFYEFGRRLSEILELSGYKPCPGKVMVSNPMWCQGLEDWEKQLAGWRDQLGFEQVRYLMIAADMRHLTGDKDLSGKLRQTMHGIFEQTSDSDGENELAAAVLRNTVRHKAALNVLGQVITEQTGEYAGEFDVKYGLYLPIVNAVRYMALEYGVSAPSTRERLNQLARMGEIPYPWLENCRSVLDTALRFRTMAPTGYLPKAKLKDKEVIRELREALGTVKLVYRTLQRKQRYAERKWL